MKRHLYTSYLRIALLLALALLGMAAPAEAASRTRCFEQTGFCVSDPILSYWERNGGLPVFGYPISEQRTETVEGWTGPLQWFERDRLENHGPDGVMAGRLGVRLLELRGLTWQTFERVTNAPQGCRFFPETGHSLCGTFLNYWERNGGLQRFGYPITQPFTEELPTWSGTVQYFERRRMELHPENAGTQYEVLLGLLGHDLMDPYGCKEVVSSLQKTTAAFPDLFNCPAPFPLVNAAMAYQPFERGAMLWVNGPNDNPGAIFVFYYDNTRGSLVWNLYGDSWREGEPTSGGERPPTGLYEPIRGFGKLWRTSPMIRETIGWAVTPEQAERGHEQYFKGGAFLLYRSSVDRVYILRPDLSAEDMPRIK